jgi:hypothetical protein
MPALNGQVITTLPDDSGNVLILATWFYDPVTGALINGTYVTSRGSQTGALIVDNLTGRQVRVVVRDATGAELRSVTVPTNGVTRTAAQMASAGYTTVQDLNGLTFDLA